MDNKNSGLQFWAKKHPHSSSQTSPKSVSSRKSSSISIPQQQEEKKNDENEEFIASSCSERNLTGSYLIKVYTDSKDVPKPTDTSNENENVNDDQVNDENESIPEGPRPSYESTSNNSLNNDQDEKEEEGMMFDLDDITGDEKRNSWCRK